MNGNRKTKSLITRREMIGATSLAALGTAVVPTAEARVQEQQYQVGKDPGKHEPIRTLSSISKRRKDGSGRPVQQRRQRSPSFPLRKALRAFPCGSSREESGNSTGTPSPRNGL